MIDFTKINKSLTDLTKWVKDGLITKQSKALVKTSDPISTDGKDGDICLVVDP